MSILKVDMDFKAPEEWLEYWVETRCMMLKGLGFTVNRIAKHPTTKGQNYFMELSEELSPETLNMLQFLLGDDQTRVKINAWRIQRGISHWNKIFDRKLWRKEAKIIECWYCGNKIPLISVENDESGKQS